MRVSRRRIPIYRIVVRALIAGAVLLALASAGTLSCASAPEIRLLEVQPANVTPDAEMERMLEPYARQVAEFHAPIGRSAVEMTRSRGADYSLGNLVADITRDHAAKATGEAVDVAFVNSGGIRAAMPQGEISTFTVMQILPFDNTIVVFTLNRARFDELCRLLAARKGYFPISGMQIRTSAEGELIEARIEPREFYRVATINYLAEGGDNLKALTTFPEPFDTGVFIRDAAIEYIRELAAKGRAIEPPPGEPRYEIEDR